MMARAAKDKFNLAAEYLLRWINRGPGGDVILGRGKYENRRFDIAQIDLDTVHFQSTGLAQPVL